MAGFFTKLGKGIGGLLGGRSGKSKPVSNLRPEQEGLYNQLTSAGIGPGAGGAFGQSADYYRNLLGNDSQDFNDFAAPQLRQYNEEIVPGLSEQFAGMGSGGLSSSGFNLAQQQGNVDLAERLGQIRANLRQSAAQGLQNIGTLGLQPYSNMTTTRQPTQGLLAAAAPGVGQGLGMAAGQQWFGGLGNMVGANNNPYRPSPTTPASPQIAPGGLGSWLGR